MSSPTSPRPLGEDKVDALMRMFEEERARHREAEVAAESRIRLLEAKLKGFNENNNNNVSGASQQQQQSSRAGGGAATRRPTTPPASSAKPRVSTLSRSNTASSSGGATSAAGNKNNSSTTPKRRATTPTVGGGQQQQRGRDTVSGTTPRTSDSLHATTPNKTPRRRIAGSPEGSPSGVTDLTHASAAPSSRSERLAAARAKRIEDDKKSKHSSSSGAGGPRTQSWASSSGKPAAVSSSSSSSKKNSSRAATPPAAASGKKKTVQQQSWEKFCDQAKAKFTPQELVDVSNETLQQLMDHFSITSAVERARIEAHWAYLNSPEGERASAAAAVGPDGTPRREHAPRVKELKYPEHPQDFDLRTMVAPSEHHHHLAVANITPRKSLRPESARGCNIDAHEFSSKVRTLRTLTLLRTRSPAQSAPDFHLQASVPKHLRQKQNSKLIDAKKNNRTSTGEEQQASRDSKKMFEKVPGANNQTEPAHGKKRAQAIDGANKTARSMDDVDGPKHSKKMVRPTTATSAEDERKGLKMVARDAAQSRDATRYVREQAERGQPRLITDSTLCTPTLSKKMAAGQQQQQQQQPVAAARRLPPQQAGGGGGGSKPSSFQLKTPFAVDA